MAKAKVTTSKQVTRKRDSHPELVSGSQEMPKLVRHDNSMEIKSAAGILRGRVVDAPRGQTAIVLVERTKIHPLYHKSFKQSKRYLVHDELGVKEADIVEIIQCRPISKQKRFKVAKVLGRDIVAMVTEQLKEEAAEAIAEVMPEEVVESEQITENREQEESKVEEKPKRASRAKKETK